MRDPIRLTLPENARIVVVGDNHGNPDLLQKVLSDVNYTESSDFLIVLGDAIEKGPDCLGGLTASYELCARGRRAYFIAGNVDRWCGRLFSGDVKSALSYCEFRPDNTLSQAARRYGLGTVSAENYEEIRRRFHEEFGAVCDWYADLPTAAESDGLIFVHSGVGADEKNYLADPKQLLSNYDFYQTRCNHTGKWVICGHIPCYNLPQTGASHCPVTDETNRIVFTDGGTIIPTGQQNVTVIEKRGTAYTFRHRFADRLPKRTVLKAAPGFPERTIRVVRDDRAYELLRKDRYFSKIRLCVSGREGYAKNELLTGDGCTGELNAFVRVRVGERVGVIRGDLEGFYYIKGADGQLGFVPRDCLSDGEDA